MGLGRFLAFDGAGSLLFNAAFLIAGYVLKDQISAFLELLSAFGAQPPERDPGFDRALDRLEVPINGSASSIVCASPESTSIRSATARGRVTADRLRLAGSPRLAAQAQRVPGARVILIDELDARHAEIPRDREIILYCA